eukprot:evm.model.scf_257.3 EVM.evm.TU.scf_257.3   scf_257:38244-38972(+)
MGLALVSANELSIDVHFGGGGGRKMLQTSTGCLTADNSCLFTAFGISVGLDEEVVEEGGVTLSTTYSTTGWATLLPGETLELCVEANNTNPSVWLYAKDLSSEGAFCPPTEGDDMPDGYVDSMKFCLHGEEPHTVIRDTNLAQPYRDDDTGVVSATCAGLGSCYGEATFYELDLPSKWSLPCLRD